MKRLYGIISGILLMMVSFPIRAQTDIQLSQHMFNRMNYNPAVTGASDYVNISGYIRDQWAGWEGAPKSQMLTVHNYFDAFRSGLGLVILHDAIGLEKSVNAKINYAYHVYLSRDSYLSLGLGIGVLYRFFDRQQILPDDIHDEELPMDIENKTYADFDFGMEFNYRHFRAGISITHLTRSAKENSVLVAGRHFYSFLRYKFPVAFRWELEPSVFVQVNKMFVHSEINVLVHYNRRFWYGTSFRVDRSMKPESIVPMAGIDISPSFRVGYSYDVNLGNLRNYSEGTHEIVVGIRIRKDRYRYSKSPRFFE